MYSEIECGICYQTFNAGRRCPRELHCHHSFCENCLQALSRPLQVGNCDTTIVCPLCRRTTSFLAETRLGVGLRVDECLLEKLTSMGLLDGGDGDEREDEEERVRHGCGDDSERTTLPRTSAEDSGSSPGSRGRRFRPSWKKVLRRVCGKSSQLNCMSNEDLRNLAMMSCYMF